MAATARLGFARRLSSSAVPPVPPPPGRPRARWGRRMVVAGGAALVASAGVRYYEQRAYDAALATQHPTLAHPANSPAVRECARTSHAHSLTALSRRSCYGCYRRGRSRACGAASPGPSCRCGCGRPCTWRGRARLGATWTRWPRPASTTLPPWASSLSGRSRMASARSRPCTVWSVTERKKARRRRLLTHSCCRDQVSPADGHVAHFGRIVGPAVEQVKGAVYDLAAFLGGALPAPRPGHAFFHVVIYLAPGDYHRFHSPTTWTTTEYTHFPGTRRGGPGVRGGD
jgi:hypothetical protein